MHNVRPMLSGAAAKATRLLLHFEPGALTWLVLRAAVLQPQVGMPFTDALQVAVSTQLLQPR